MGRAPKFFSMLGCRLREYSKSFSAFVSKAKTISDVSLILFKEITLFYLNTITPTALREVRSSRRTGNNSNSI